MRRLDIGVASYRGLEKLRATLESIARMSVTDWRCFIVHNPSDDDAAVRDLVDRAGKHDSRFVPVVMERNVGYAGAVNELLRRAETEFVAYCDNDVEIMTPGWDERFCLLLEKHAEIAQVFPGLGHYGFVNGEYRECLWSAGFCWVLRKAAIGNAYGLGGMDEALGHHEEVDLMIRLRLAGYRIACEPAVQVIHHETATRADAADHRPGGRIHDGVVRWMNKWNRYFCGDALTYSMTEYDPRALRYTDWPPCALYLERWVLAQFPALNAAPLAVQTSAGVMDAIEVLKPSGCYRGRCI